jgi:quinoprotein glucose dehydrogenase
MNRTSTSLTLVLFASCAWSPFAYPDASSRGLEAEQPLRSVAEEAATLQSGRLRAQQRALARLGKHRDPAAAQLLLEQFERYRAGNLPTALWIELFEAAAQSRNRDLSARLAEEEARLKQSNDPLAQFHQCLEGGDGEAGEKIFRQKLEAGCVRCHSVDGAGGEIGPDLTWLRRSSERMHLLESVILPNATIATGFSSEHLKLKSGEELSGVVKAESDHRLVLTSIVDGTKRTVRGEDIEKRSPLPSPMPPYFGTVLTKRELRDLIEFLAEGG